MLTWRFEIVKMGLYLAFPVGIFHWFNRPGVFDDYALEIRTKYGKLDNPEVKKQLEEFAEKFNRERLNERYALIEEQMKQD